MNSVFFLGETAGNGDERFNTKNSNSILIVLRKLPEDWKQFLDDMLLVKASCKFSKFSSTCASDHGCVFLTEFHEFFPKSLFLRIWSLVCSHKETTWRNSSSEKICLCKSDHEWTENFFQFLIWEMLWDFAEGPNRLFADNGFIWFSQLFEQLQKYSLFLQQFPTNFILVINVSETKLTIRSRVLPQWRIALHRPPSQRDLQKFKSVNKRAQNLNYLLSRKGRRLLVVSPDPIERMTVFILWIALTFKWISSVVNSSLRRSSALIESTIMESRYVWSNKIGLEMLKKWESNDKADWLIQAAL